jgi:hypothetical protein
MECRLKRGGDWERLCDGTFEKADCEEFFASLDRDDDGLFRYRMLPQYGYDTTVFAWVPEGGWKDEGRLILSRDMPRSVHELNDEILSSLGI